MKNFMLAGLLLLLFFSPRIFWQLKPATEMDLAIIDKTTPSTDYREHLGLFWLLTNEKIVKPSGEYYAIGKDYFGYAPETGEPMNAYNITRQVDLIYIADTYGVYTEERESSTNESRSQKIYGGMEENEWNSILNSKGEGTTLIAEYNSFASPTEEGPRSLMEETLGVEWSGWSGRYFDDLTSIEVPSWLVTNYEDQYQQNWSFTGGGLAFVHNTDQVVILDDNAIKEKISFSLTAAGEKKFSESSSVQYPYWFDILTPGNDTIIYAKYNLQLSQKAQKELEQVGIPTSFPAVVYHPENNTYYFAGDYADFTKDNLMKWHRSDFLMSIFSTDSSKFFWYAYIPMMRVILDDVKNNRNK